MVGVRSLSRHLSSVSESSCNGKHSQFSLHIQIIFSHWSWEFRSLVPQEKNCITGSAWKLSLWTSCFLLARKSVRHHHRETAVFLACLICLALCFVQMAEIQEIHSCSSFLIPYGAIKSNFSKVVSRGNRGDISNILGGCQETWTDLWNRVTNESL